MLSESLTLLRQQVFAVHPLEEDAWTSLAACWSEITVKRKEILTRAGDTEQHLYFVVEGIQRAVYVDDKREATLVFSFPPSFSGIIDSFFLQQPSRFSLETLTAGRLLRIHYRDLTALMQQYRSIETFVRIALTAVLAGTLQRQIEIMSFSAVEKFTALLHRSPHVLNLIPHKYLASYIGVDPATFSKLLASVRL